MRAGAPWGEPRDPDAPVVAVPGGADADLARAAVDHPSAILRFHPSGSSDLARAVGLVPGGEGATVLACDLLHVDGHLDAVNAVVLGQRADRLRWWNRARRVTVAVDGRRVMAGRATTVVVASGQFIAGANVVPRGHPGDGRLEVQVYSLRPGERRAMRVRLATGDHVPHPRIFQTSGKRVEVRWEDGPRPVEVDGCRLPPRATLAIEVRPGAARVLV